MYKLVKKARYIRKKLASNNAFYRDRNREMKGKILNSVPLNSISIYVVYSSIHFLFKKCFFFTIPANTLNTVIVSSFS